MLVTAEEYKRRMAVYLQGLADAEAAALLGISGSGFAAWRQRNGLSPNYRGNKPVSDIVKTPIDFKNIPIGDCLFQHTGVTSQTKRRIMAKPEYERELIKEFAIRLLLWKGIRRVDIKEIVPECYICTRNDGKYCYGWTDPAFMWRGRTCPHVSTEPYLLRKIKDDVKRYLAQKEGVMVNRTG